MVLAELHRTCRREVLGLGMPLAAVPSSLVPGHEERMAEHAARIVEYYRVYRVSDDAEQFNEKGANGWVYRAGPPPQRRCSPRTPSYAKR